MSNRPVLCSSDWITANYDLTLFKIAIAPRNHGSFTFPKASISQKLHQISTRLTESTSCLRDGLNQFLELRSVWEHQMLGAHFCFFDLEGRIRVTRAEFDRDRENVT